MKFLAIPIFAVALLATMLSTSVHAGLPLKDHMGRELPSLAPLLEHVTPAVVNISVYTTRSAAPNPMLNDPFFRRFFNIPDNAPQQRKRRTQAAGSGVIIDAKDGIVVTNHHVIDGADEIEVGLQDGRTYTAELLGGDEEVDIAVLKIKAKNLVALKFANSEHVRVGDYAIAIGNPFGLSHSVTSGLVSGLSRTGLGIEGYENFIQTDASINPGNSGGALINLRGELIGINTAIIGKSGGSVGIGFAIPTNMAKASIDQIREHGEVRRGQLGVIIQDLTKELAEAFDIDKFQRGVLIAEVLEGSEAEKAGIEAGDVVFEVNGKPIHNTNQLRNAVGVRQVGEKLDLKILREGKEKTLKVAIGTAAKRTVSSNVHKLLEGAKLKDYDKGGVVIEDIAEGSAAAQTALRPGDIIKAANRMRVNDLEELEAAAQRSADRLLLRIQRGRAALYLVLQ